jgi:hypothetical protein
MTGPFRNFWMDLRNRGAVQRDDSQTWPGAAVAVLATVLGTIGHLVPALEEWLARIPPMELLVRGILPLSVLGLALWVITAKTVVTVRASGFNATEETRRVYVYTRAPREVAKLALPILAVLGAIELHKAVPRYSSQEVLRGYACRADTGQPIEDGAIEVLDVFGRPLIPRWPLSEGGFFQADLPAFSFRIQSVRLHSGSCRASPLGIPPKELQAARCPAQEASPEWIQSHQGDAPFYAFTCE